MAVLAAIGAAAAKVAPPAVGQVATTSTQAYDFKAGATMSALTTVTSTPPLELAGITTSGTVILVDAALAVVASVGGSATT